MLDKYQNKYRISSARLASWDYSSNGRYFITVCTKKRNDYFGQIINGEMQLSEIGKIARQCWMEIPDHFLFVNLDEFVVMPNHMHGIIIIDTPVMNGGIVETGHALSLLRRPPRQLPQQQYHPRFRNQGKNSISSMVGSCKSAVTKWCNENHISFGWQTRFHDHIIRDDNEFERIRNYIMNNPANWEMDKFFKR
jgi:REP element-mobilizing transposase RayT